MPLLSGVGSTSKRRWLPAPTQQQRAGLHQHLQQLATMAFTATSNQAVSRASRQYMEVVTDWLPEGTPALPVTHKTLSAYAALYTGKNSAKGLGTVVSRLKVWATAHCGSTFLPSEHDKAAWRLTRRALSRIDAATTPPRLPKLALRMRDLAHLFPRLDMANLQDLQLWLALCLSLQSCLRGADTTGVHLRARSIKFTDSGATVVLRQHKTSFTPATLAFPNRTDMFSVPHLLRRYVAVTRLDKAAAEVPETLLFPTFDAKGSLTMDGARTPRWTVSSWRRMLRTRMAQAGFQAAACLGTHCLRIGGATDYLDSGCEVHVVQLLGRWRTAQVIRDFYDRRDRSAMASAVQGLTVYQHPAV